MIGKPVTTDPTHDRAAQDSRSRRRRLMPEIGQRAGIGRPRVWRWRRRRRRTRRWPPWRRRSAPARMQILAANAEDIAGAKAVRRHRRLPRPARARRQAHRRHGGRPRRGARARRSGRRGDRALDAAERHDHRARAGAARRRRHHLREPSQRHRRRRRALPQGRQRGDPARRLREPELEPRDPCGAARGSARGRTCRRRRSSWCRPATARRSGACSPGSTAAST